MQPQIPGFEMIVDGCSYSFLIKHHNPNAKSKYDNLLFDLGARTDFQNGPTVLMEQAKAMGFSFSVEKDVATILKDNGANLADIGGVIWSHCHAVSEDRLYGFISLLMFARIIPETHQHSQRPLA
jgi:hypothetical protein